MLNSKQPRRIWSTDSKQNPCYCLNAALEKKAKTQCSLELKGGPPLLIIFSFQWQVDRQVQAMPKGLRSPQKGKGSCLWPGGKDSGEDGFYLDYEDVVVHTFSGTRWENSTIWKALGWPPKMISKKEEILAKRKAKATRENLSDTRESTVKAARFKKRTAIIG